MESRQPTGRITASLTAPSEPRLSINYVLSGPANDKYQSKHQQKKLVRAATVKARVNAVHAESSQREAEPIDGLISFPFVNSNRIIMLHYDALVLTLCINGFDVHKVLVDTGNASIFITTSSLHTDEAFF